MTKFVPQFHDVNIVHFIYIVDTLTINVNNLLISLPVYIHSYMNTFIYICVLRSYVSCECHSKFLYPEKGLSLQHPERNVEDPIKCIHSPEKVCSHANILFCFVKK